VAGRDITEGRAERSIAFDVGVVSSSAIWQNTDISYDVAVGGQPFIYAINDARPYVRQTAPFKKDQFDNGAEPGEQSLTGWWMRSQSSFHNGTGIKYYDPTAGEIVLYRYADSDNVDVWTKGQVTLLKETTNTIDTGIYKLITGISGGINVAISYIPGSTTLKDIEADATTLTTYATTASGILDVVTNGTTLFVANATRIYYETIGATGALNNHYSTGSALVKMAWVKQRLVAGIGTSIYELTGALGTTTLPTAVYTHPNTGWEWTSISEGGSAIYAAGYAGGNSAIYKFVLSEADGTMPTLTSGIVAAQLPIGEIVYKIESYLGYLMIGTNKGMRVATISDTTGDLSYGPLLFEDTNGVRDFAFRDKYVWAAGTINGSAGLYRVDLGTEIESLRFAYANDTYLSGATGYATSVDFIGNTNQLAFTTSGSNGIAIQSDTVLASSGSITTGKIRFSTLEPKNFKRLLARGNYDNGSMTLYSIESNGDIYDHISYDSVIGAPEVNTLQPVGSHEYLSYKFQLFRDEDDSTLGPVFEGYQAKATIATPRQRVLQFPVYCFDVETDRFNVLVGYKGKALERIQALENIEATGDIVNWQDLTTGETRQAVIEQIQFTRMTPPDKRFDGFGGVIQITIRTV
jgi:hypothetical protein